MIGTDREKTVTGIEELTVLLEKTTLPGQREAIMAEDPLVVVSAGAGTGKTWTLAWRFVWAIATGKARVKEILTLTFTEKAALEMKDRIRDLLGKVASLVPSLSPLLEEAREEMDEAFISTLHSFSLRMIREGGLSLELDPESRPVSTPEEEELWREVEKQLDILDNRWFKKRVRGIWTSREEQIFDKPFLTDLVNSYGARGITGLTRGILSLWASRGQDPGDLWSFSKDLEKRDQEALARVRKIYSTVFEEEWQRWSGSGGLIPGLPILLESKTQLAEKLRGVHSKWGEEKPQREDLPLFFLDLMEALKGASGKAAAEIAQELECSVSEFRNQYSEHIRLCEVLVHGIDGRDRQTRETLLEVSSLLWQIWEEYKRKKSLISFDDMISRSIEALQAGSMAERFREVLVDEFQDTNRLQEILLRTIWERGSPAMFLVGDLKQSIYRFRHAEPSIFLEYIQKALQGKGKYINLDVSFRSSGKVLEGINSIFGKIWEKGLGRDLIHPYEHLQSPVTMDWHSRRQEIQTPPLKVLVEFYTSGKERTPAEEKRLDLARRLGRELMQLREKGTLIWDKKEEGLRPLQWSDMAILVPTRNQYSALERAFIEDLSIPCYFESSLGYYSRSEVQDLLSLVDYLADKRDQTALTSFLSSPFSGLSLEKTGKLLEEKRDTGKDLAEILQNVNPSLSHEMEGWRRIATLEGVSRVFSIILSRADTLKAFPAWKRKKAAANLRKAVDISREYESAMGNDLRGCSEYLRGSMGRGIAMEDADFTGEQDDVVRIMTVHASKGLEFPVLAIMGMEYFPGKRSHGTSLDPSAILGVTPSRYPDGIASDNKDTPSSPVLAAMMEKQEQLEEWQRLFYVAATRARDSLFLCATLEAKEGDNPEPRDGTWLSMIGEKIFPDLALATDRVKPAKKQNSRVSEQKERTFVQGPVKGNEYLARLSATSYSLFKFCPLAWRMRHRQGRDLKWELPGAEGPGGSDLGNLAHWILQKWDLSEDGLENYLPLTGMGHKSVATGIPVYILPEWKKPDSRETLRKWLRDLSISETGRTLKDLLCQGVLNRELPFRIRMDHGPLLTGAMDLMWEKDNIIHIRDYKITAQEKAPEELYTSQLLFYGWTAYHALRDRDLPVDLRLIHLREGIETERIAMPGGGMEEIEEDIRRSAQQAANGPFEPELGKCNACPFRNKCPLHGDTM